MSIKRAKANHYYNETDYDTLHYETQIEQVKVLDTDGNVTGNLNEELGEIDKDIELVNNRVDETNDNIDVVKGEIGTVSTLSTSAKKVIPAINELKEEIDTNANDISTSNGSISKLKDDFNKHLHDDRYLRLSGGNLTGMASMSNNTPFAGKNTSGTTYSIGKVDDVNNVVIGDVNAKTVINSRNSDVKINNGINEYKVYHSGNDGAGSGLDADKLDGIDSDSFARRNTQNRFQYKQHIENGYGLELHASSGSSTAGELTFSDGSGNRLGEVSTSADGDLYLYGKSRLGFKVLSSGQTETTWGHTLNAKNRQVTLKFKKDDDDAGMGIYYNQNAGGLGLYDWESEKYFFTTDRERNIVSFTNHLKIQGHRFYVQSSAPTIAQTGDVWIDI